MLECSVILENGEKVEMETGNQLISQILDCLKNKGFTVMYSNFILDEVKMEISKIAKI